MRAIVHAVVLGVCALPLVNVMALAGSSTLSIPMRGVATITDERGTYFFVACDLPPDLAGKRLDSAFLEVVIDVAPGSNEDEAVPYDIGVFPLMERFVGTNPIFESGVSSPRLIPPGDNRRALVDITRIVRRWIADPAGNYGLVLGALTGPKPDGVSIKDSVLDPDTAVRVTFFYQNRFGGPVPAKPTEAPGTGK